MKLILVGLVAYIDSNLSIILETSSVENMRGGREVSDVLIRFAGWFSWLLFIWTNFIKVEPSAFTSLRLTAFSSSVTKAVEEFSVEGPLLCYCISVDSWAGWQFWTSVGGRMSDCVTLVGNGGKFVKETSTFDVLASEKSQSSSNSSSIIRVHSSALCPRELHLKHVMSSAWR